MYYLNLFRDKNGIAHYSCEEFSTLDDTITDFAEALADAFQLSAHSDWRYVATLASNDALTTLVSSFLSDLSPCKNTFYGLNGDEIIALLQE